MIIDKLIADALGILGQVASGCRYHAQTEVVALEEVLEPTLREVTFDCLVVLLVQLLRLLRDRSASQACTSITPMAHPPS